jgi:predicted DNA-binding transcriptional regulator AlpA
MPVSTTQETSMVTDRILRGPAAAAKLGVSPRQFLREVAKGNIPAGIRISERATGWRESTLERVISDRENGRMRTDND